MRRARFLRRVASVGPVLAMLALLASAPGAWASAPTLNWSSVKTGATFNGWQALTNVLACAPGMCAEAAGGGDPSNAESAVETTANVTAAVPTWSASPMLTSGGETIDSLSCPSSSLCVGVDQGGDVYYTSDASDPTPLWTAMPGALPGPAQLQGAGSYPSLSCPSTALCVAVLQGSGAVYTADMSAPSPSWSAVGTTSAAGLDGVACSAAGQCVAWDSGGVVYRTSDASSGSWSATPASVDRSITGASCPGGGLCLLTDADGNVLTSTDGGATWSSSALSAGTYLNSISCPTTTFCAVADMGNGDVFLTGDPADPTPQWSTANIATGAEAVSCADPTLCVVQSSSGVVVGTSYPIGAPTVVTGGSQSDSESVQTLSATVDPNGDPVTGCEFLYGTEVSYSGRVPCSALPGGGTTDVQVSAQVSGLTPGATYHYAIEATNSYASMIGADATFVAGSIASTGPGGGSGAGGSGGGGSGGGGATGGAGTGGGGGSAGSGPSRGGGSCLQSVNVTDTIIAEGCFASRLGELVSSADVRINGIDFTPGPGGTVAVAPHSGLVDLAGTGLVHVGAVPLESWAGLTHLNLTSGPLTVSLGSTQKISANLFGLAFVAPVTIAFGSNASAQISATVSLKVLGDAVGGDASLGTSNAGGLQVNTIRLSVGGTGAASAKSYRVGAFCEPDTPPPAGWQCAPVPDDPTAGKLQKSTGYIVNIGGKLPVQNLSCSFRRVGQGGNYGASGDGEWDCSAVIGLNSLFGGFSVEGKAPTLTVGGGILYPPPTPNDFNIGLSGVNVPIGPVVLHSVSFTVRLKPTLEISGDISLGAGPPVDTNVNDRVVKVDGRLDFQLGSRSGFKLSISGTLSIADLHQQFGKASVTWDGTNGNNQITLSFTADLNVADLMSGSAHLGGSVNASHYQFFGDANVKIMGQSISGHAVISDAGLGACGTLHIAIWSGSLGAEYLYSTHAWHFTGCDFSSLQTLGNAGAAAVGTPDATIQVHAGLPRLEVVAVGASTPPEVELIGPHGQRARTPSTPDRLVVRGHVLSTASSADHSTYFLMDHPAPGAWKLLTPAGSQRPLQVQQAMPLLPVRPQASVTGRGGRRVLRWSLRAQPGVAVQFMERGHGVLSTIAVERRAHGRLSFLPAAGAGGRRQILALVTVDGIARGLPVVVGGYTPPQPAHPHVRSASYQQIGRAVLVVFDRARGASGYEVSVTLGNHRGNVQRVLGRHAGAAALILPAGTAARRVVVSALENGLLQRPTVATRTRFRRHRAHRSGSHRSRAVLKDLSPARDA